MAPIEPHVPGALGKYPRPNQVASRSETCGLGPRVECAVLVSADAVIASRVSQQVDQSQVLISAEWFGAIGQQVYFGRDLASANHLCSRRDPENVAANLVFGFVTAVGQIENDGFAVAFFAVVFIEDGIGHHILFTGPISEVAPAASFAAKWKIRMHRGIGGGFTYRAFVFHIVPPGL